MELRTLDGPGTFTYRSYQWTDNIHTPSELSDTAVFKTSYTIFVTMSSYQYASLPTQGKNIRLLRLLPNQDEAAPLQCELLDYSLPKSEIRCYPYEALSSVWGNPDVTLPIRVGEDQFPVIVNLHAALLRLRDPSFERIIWVDAVCINQGNHVEQGRQVQLMAKIYSSAQRVIVWLGEETQDTEGALEDIRLAANGESRDETKKERVYNLLHRPWFQRIWLCEQTLDYTYRATLK